MLTRLLLILSASAVLACTAGAQDVPTASAAKEHLYLDNHAIENSGAAGNAQGKAAAPVAQVPATPISVSQPSPAPVQRPVAPPARPTALIPIPMSAAHLDRTELIRKYPPGIVKPAKSVSAPQQ